jgi:predicted nucleic acid-binding protein
MRRRYVLDAWAILALLQGEEPAASRIRELMRDSEDRHAELYLSLMNLGEVYYCVGRARGESQARETLEDVRRLPLTFIPVTEEAVLAAAGLKMRYAISYADAFAAAATEAKDAILVSGDPEFAHLAGRVPLERLERSRTA